VEDQQLATNGPARPKPDPAPVPPKVPGPIPWISTQPVSEVSLLDGEDRLIPREGEVFVIGTNKEH
jgi:hypothetical protein